MAENSGSGSTGILGVVVGALIVIVVLFFIFGGWGWITGGPNGPNTVDVTVETPAPSAAPSTPAPAETN